MKLLIKTMLALALVSSIGAAHACSTSQWSTATATAESVTVGATRYEGLCALKVQAGKKVEQNINGSGDTYFRFYVYVDRPQTSNVKIFSARSGGSEAALLTLGGGNTLRIGGKSTALQARKWTQVQLRVNGTRADVWVNNAKKLSNVSVTGGNIDRISLGSLGGAQTGNIYFDAFVASNGEAVGNDGVSIGSDKQLIPGDATGDGVINLFDLFKVKRDIDRIAFSDGVPDCNTDGKVSIFDLFCIKNKI